MLVMMYVFLAQFGFTFSMSMHSNPLSTTDHWVSKCSWQISSSSFLFFVCVNSVSDEYWVSHEDGRGSIYFSNVCTLWSFINTGATLWFCHFSFLFEISVRILLWFFILWWVMWCLLGKVVCHVIESSHLASYVHYTSCFQAHLCHWHSNVG